MPESHLHFRTEEAVERQRKETGDNTFMCRIEEKC